MGLTTPLFFSIFTILYINGEFNALRKKKKKEKDCDP